MFNITHVVDEGGECCNLLRERQHSFCLTCKIRYIKDLGTAFER